MSADDRPPQTPPTGEAVSSAVDLDAVRTALAAAEMVKPAAAGGGEASNIISIRAGRKRKVAADGAARGAKDSLLELALSAELWQWDGEAYATFRVCGHRENAKVRSRAFSGWLRARLYEDTGAAAAAQTMEDVLALAEARAATMPPRQPFIRIGHDAEASFVYVDLGQPGWQCVEISAHGWRVIDESPVPFLRPKGLLPLPLPLRGGSLEALKPFLNVVAPEGFTLAIAWLVGCFHPVGPFPVLALRGEQGSAKSTTAKLLRRLVDPHTAALRSPPREDRDLSIAAMNTFVLGLDNLSGLSEWLADGLCRIATGSGYGARRLHTGTEEDIFSVCRPIILNGISDVSSRPDLADRALAVYCPPIPPEARRPERRLLSAFEEEQPYLLGALFEAVAAALKGWRDLELSPSPRMADFATWIVASERAGGLPWSEGEFLDVYQSARLEASRAAVDDDPFANALFKFAMSLVRVEETGPHQIWEGTATKLLSELRASVPEALAASKMFPQSPRALSERCRRLAPDLRALGVDLKNCRVGNARTRLIRIEVTSTAAS